MDSHIQRREENKWHYSLQEGQEGEDPENCRLVTLTLVLGKVIEQLSLETISMPFKDKKIIRSSQHSFTNAELCMTNLINFYDEMTGLVDEGKPVDVPLTLSLIRPL